MVVGQPIGALPSFPGAKIINPKPSALNRPPLSRASSQFGGWWRTEKA